MGAIFSKKKKRLTKIQMDIDFLKESIKMLHMEFFHLKKIMEEYKT